jgi:MFS family permease
VSDEKTPPSPDASVAPGRWLNRTVFGAGLTSAFGDLTYETTNVILPGFLAVLGIHPAALGIIEGVADGLASFTKLGAGYVADRLGHRKALVVAGYGLTALMQVFMALASGWALVLLGRVIGWFGKGIRGPLRDAIVAEAVTPATRGRAFGFHRAADTLGAVLGPLLGVALLAWAQTLPLDDPSGAFRLVFWLTLIPGILSVLSFALLVKDDRSQPNPHLRFWATIRGLPKDFRRYLGAVGVFGLGDFAHTLLILASAQLLEPRMGRIAAAEVAGLLYVGRNAVQVLASFPLGLLADRWGHRPVLVIGYALGTAMAALLVLAFAAHIDSVWLLGGVFTLAGVYIAAQDALEPALTADFVSPQVRSTAYGVLGTVNGVGDLVSSVMVGLLSMIGPAYGFAYAAGMMLIGTLLLARRRDADPR